MLEHLQIIGGACFGSEALTISGLKTVNFFYGPNGSGKTTISRAFAGNDSPTANYTWDDSLPMKIKVYNRDFVDHILRESNRIPGVFVIGEKSVEAEKRIEEIQGEGGEKKQAQDRLTAAKTSLSTVQATQKDAENTLREIAWRKYKGLVTHHTSLEPAFTGTGGIGNSKQGLLSRLLATAPPAEDNPSPSLEELLSDATAVFAQDATTHSELPYIPDFHPSEHDGYTLLEMRLVGSAEVTLSQLVEQLQNSDWVAQGIQYLEKSDGRCPFCQETAPVTLVNDLAAMFDARYTTQLNALDNFVSAFKAWHDKVLSADTTYMPESKAYVEQVGYTSALAALTRVLSENLAILEDKQRTPSEPVNFSPVAQNVNALNDLLKEANGKIRAHNKLVGAQREERPKLVARCNRYLAEVLLNDELVEYRRKAPGRSKAIEALGDKVRAAEGELQELDEEVRSLERSVESTRPVIERINEILRRSGFTSFEIVESLDLKDGYMLSRDGGEIQEHSLSEGERTFIAFLYFFHLLDARGATDGSSRVLAVVDDPISSLDSDVLFVVSSLVRNLVGRAQSRTDHVEQLIILTHNVYFHKEITYVRDGDSRSGRIYFVIRKNSSAPSHVELHRDNPVSTEYQRLWGEVRRAIGGETLSIVGLENVLRRILESYFRVTGGGIWDAEIAPLLSTSERHVFRSMFSWANEGSHSVLEEVHFSPSSVTQATYLEVFRRVFEATGHESHYRMMLYGKDSLDPAEKRQFTEPEPAKG